MFGLVGVTIVDVGARPPQQQATATTQAPPAGRRGMSAGRMGGAPHPDQAWWEDPEARRAIGLSPTQVSTLEKIFNDAAPALKELGDSYNQQTAELERLVKDPNVTERAVSLQYDQVEFWRSKINKSRFLMLWRMLKVLTPEQSKKLDDYRARKREHDGRGGIPRPER